ncbi:Cation-chloride cotransporter [Blattamonas nauphoetae]|uniref:Cation-chloride cotransporter n=1 Tax=Blattamonas nauphoetae TaxID=2049346 RepID=A0ABQ9Y4C0_9EUKA|nr:Cation-chloride cotransporter [Blattamonas nauphoetae]
MDEKTALLGSSNKSAVRLSAGSKQKNVKLPSVKALAFISISQTILLSFPTMMSTILYQRLGFAASTLGILLTILVIAFAVITNCFTVFSIGQLTGTGQMKDGGAYFLVSRTLGSEFGGTLGILMVVFLISNALTNVWGIIEIIDVLIPQFREHNLHMTIIQRDYVTALIGLGILFILFLISLLPTKITIRSIPFLAIPVVVFALISLFVLFFHKPFFFSGYSLTGEPLDIHYGSYQSSNFKDALIPHLGAKNPFAMVLSSVGALSNIFSNILIPLNACPRNKLTSNTVPLGLSVAQIFGGILFITFLIPLGSRLTVSDMTTELFLIPRVVNSQFMFPVMFAVYSISAIYSLISAAQILLCMAKDKVIPGLSKFAYLPQCNCRKRLSSSDSDIASQISEVSSNFSEASLVNDFLFPPSHSTLNQEKERTPSIIPSIFLVYVVSAILMFIIPVIPEQVDTLASLSAILASACSFFLNLSCVLHFMIGAPNFRSSFRLGNRYISILGGIFNILIAIMSSPWICGGVAAIAALLTLVLHLVHKDSDSDYGEVTQSFIFHNTRKDLLSLDVEEQHVKYWRPNLLFFCSFPTGTGKFAEKAVQDIDGPKPLTRFIPTDLFYKKKGNEKSEQNSFLVGPSVIDEESEEREASLIPFHPTSIGKQIGDDEDTTTPLVVANVPQHILNHTDEDDEAEDDSKHRRNAKNKRRGPDYFGTNHTGKVTLNICNDLKKGGILVLTNVLIVHDDDPATVRPKRRQNHDDERDESEFPESCEKHNTHSLLVNGFDSSLLANVNKTGDAMEASIHQGNMKAFPIIVTATSFRSGVQSLLLSQGLGGMRTNTCVFRYFSGDKSKGGDFAFDVKLSKKGEETLPTSFASVEEYVATLHDVAVANQNFLLFRQFDQFHFPRDKRNGLIRLFSKYFGRKKPGFDFSLADEKRRKAKRKQMEQTGRYDVKQHRQKYIDVWLTPADLTGPSIMQEYIEEFLREERRQEAQGAALPVNEHLLQARFGGMNEFGWSASLMLVFGHILSRQMLWKQYKLRARVIVWVNGESDHSNQSPQPDGRRTEESARDEEPRRRNAPRSQREKRPSPLRPEQAAPSKPTPHTLNPSSLSPSEQRIKQFFERLVSLLLEDLRVNASVDVVLANPLHPQSESVEDWISQLNAAMRSQSKDSKLCFVPIQSQPPSLIFPTSLDSLSPNQHLTSLFNPFLSTFPRSEQAQFCQRARIFSPIEDDYQSVNTEPSKIKEERQALRKNLQGFTTLLDTLTDDLPPTIVVYAPSAVVTTEI